MACRKRGVEELGRPQQLLYGGSDSAWYTALEAQKGKPGHGTMLAPRTATDHGPTGEETEAVRRMRLGSLITRSTQRWGKPTTRGRT